MIAPTPEREIRDRLKEVLDPCSCFTDRPVDIIDLGLVEDVSVADGTARIELLLTSPGCTYLPYIERDVQERVGDIPQIDAVEVVMLTDQLWTPERMDNSVRRAREDRLRDRLDAAGIEPYAYTTE